MNFFKLIIVFVCIFSFTSCHQNDTIINPDLDGFSFSDFEPIDVDLSNRDQCDKEAPLYPDLTGKDLRDYLKYCYRPTVSFTYTQARIHLYSNVDVVNGKLQCIYSGYETVVEPAAGQSYINAAASKGINTEHVYPQSMGASETPARSDMFHLYPALANVNSARSNKYFAEIPNNRVFEWFKSTQVSATTPTSNLEEWSKSNDLAWEPRDDRKGDIARSVFYFRLMYDNVANDGFFQQMKNTLLQWHIDDPVDARERNRNNKIKALQGNDNPFIIDAELAERIY